MEIKIDYHSPNWGKTVITIYDWEFVKAERSVGILGGWHYSWFIENRFGEEIDETRIGRRELNHIHQLILSELRGE